LKRAWRPAEQLRESFEDIHQFHQGFVQTLGDAIDTSYDHYRPRFAQALTGEAGDALLASHDATVQTWSTHQDMHASAATAAAQALGHIKGLQGRIDNLAEAGEEEFNTAIRNRDPAAAMDVWTRYNGLAETSTSETITKATGAIQAANFTIPLDVPKSPKGKDGQQTESGKDGDKKPGDKTGDGEKTGNATPDGSQTATKPANQNTTTPPDAPPGATPDAVQGDVKPAAPQGDGMQTPTTSTPFTQIPKALSGAASGGQGGGSGGSGMSGLGSAFKPPSSMGSSMPTSPASSMPSAPSAPSSSAAASPMSNPGSSFQSGLASGMRAAGGDSLSGMASPVSQQSVTQQGLAAHQAAGAPAFGSGPAGMPMSAPGGGAGVGGSPGGSPSSGGTAGGGMPMMPPAAMGGAAPLAPYSAPGAGAGGSAGGGGAGTAPAASGQSSSAGSGSLGAPGPVVAGGAGSSVSAPGLAAMDEVNPDLLLAQRVLAGLVRGSQHYPTLVLWAVSVLRMPMGSQVVIASNIGDGGYLPPDVFIPSTARLAVVDPVLPFGWAQQWMGCRFPAKVLVDHFEQVSKKVAGVTMSALVTTESYADKPACANDFLAIRHMDALNMLSQAPILDGGHQHRLAALDPVLDQRLRALDQRRYAPAVVAGQLTLAVIQAAERQPEVAECKLVTADEINMLASVNRGTADDVSWRLYDQLVDQRHNGALVLVLDTYGIEYLDGSEANQSAATVYKRYYQAGRIAEMARCWRYSPPSVADIAYCGIQAGFGSVVAAVISALEMHAQQHGRTA
jgi:hypothetical protein